MRRFAEDDRIVQQATDPPRALVAFWRARVPDLVPPDADWRRLSGGRTNEVWQVAGAQGPVVVKLFRAGSGTPLFPNDPAAEEVSLTALASAGLGPKLLAAELTPEGRSLVYAYVHGHPWSLDDDVTLVAVALASLHRIPPPPSLPRRPLGAERLRSETLAIGETLGRRVSALLSALPSVVPPPGPVRAAFLHGDPTAANTVVTPEGITFIDWQCPGAGDPADDLSIFLSPAMQVISGNAPLGPDREARFLEAYARAGAGGEATVGRYLALAPLYHARMAAYAFWRAARGDDIYDAAAEAEIARLRTTR